MEVYIGTICAFTLKYVPYGWLACDGSTCLIVQYQALAALITGTYGTNTNTTFVVPDLRGRVAIGASNTGTLGTVVGSDGTLTSANMPAHNHTIGFALGCYNGVGNSAEPAGNYPAQTMATGTGRTANKSYASTPGANMAQIIDISIGNAGVTSPAPVNKMPPYQVTPYFIAYEGFFPIRP
ncbi:hypothetical protein CJD36_021245 [Flavipsychrobacter stenotrophus]|uniref:Phage tail collar domain-containing protein n=1 Tax=Flavipsychrobacter stenotrophus TaxID=2077091 RepID=A0A2S7SQD4_9BACT|nr:tail fiber protein [Flavipsychrobacter stenotrophus]PQJ09100.1 hypothetical protein CJD36_021245 [Flavipsychrobacter stenotrophus]